MSGSSSKRSWATLIGAVATIVGGVVGGWISGEKAAEEAARQYAAMQVERKLGGNLLVNGGAELGSTYAWTTVPVGYTVRHRDPAPYEGKHYFFPGRKQGNGVAIAAQRVDLTLFGGLINQNRLSCNVDAWVASYEDQQDYTRLILRQYLSGMDKPESVVVAEPKSGKMQAQWQHISVSAAIRPGVVTAEVVLESVYRDGERNNDGYFDDVRLLCDDLSSPPNARDGEND